MLLGMLCMLWEFAVEAKCGIYSTSSSGSEKLNINCDHQLVDPQAKNGAIQLLKHPPPQIMGWKLEAIL